ncbi:hypothetical protein [Raoultella sp. R2A007]|uniref:hypothetical protein n=1 Tax=Raoultella sp. R2A007 TaxID=3416669 RepID=UPI003CF62A8B
MKAKYIIGVALVAGSLFQPVFAISEAYRAQLERSGCTQVSEANGTCHVGHASHQYQDADNHKRNARREAAEDIAHDLDANIAGMYHGQAVDFMQEEGWHSINDEHTRWKKSGFTVAFDMTTSGRLAGVTVQ